MHQKSHHFHPASRWLARSSKMIATSPAGEHETIAADAAEEDLPMDEFDRALLAEAGDVQQIGHERSFGMLNTPSRLGYASCTAEPAYRYRGDLLDDLQRNGSSSSPTCSVSSPTKMMLQNRREAHERPHELHRLQNTNGPERQKEHSQPHRYPHNPASALNLDHAPPIVQGIRLVNTSELSDNMRSMFKFALFNAVQSRCFPHAYGGDDNLVVSAPTGSGKTVIMELAICRLLKETRNREFKVVYQAPTRSLCAERQRDWSTKFHTLGLKCAELTGDVEYSNLKNVQQADIIIATPEKWDSVTRKWRDNAKLMRMIRLFLVDEVHILREARGATLEAVVARMKSVGTDVRFVALSATVPNSEDIATWLGLNPTSQNIPAKREVFGEEFRPTELEKHVFGYKCPPNDFVLDGILVKEIPPIIARFSKRKPVMIFCPTQKSAAKMAQSLAELWLASSEQSQLWNRPHNEIVVRNTDLQKVVNTAVAFHHGSLDVADRSAVEQGFLNGDINVICSTSTLAVGVNLPCYLVILKGTSCYTDSGLQEYSMLDVMQMLGRAGRPQFETSACAIIMTSKEKMARYQKLISGEELLESSLHENLIEHLNAEIGVGTIKDIASARKWLTSTFLYVRVQQNPTHYKAICATQLAKSADLLNDICEQNIEMLRESGMIDDGDKYQCTDFGHAMARYYVKFETMKSLLTLPPHAKMSEILEVLTQAVEFKDLRWRNGERGLFKKINKSNEIRFPIKVDVASQSHKASLLLQAALGAFALDKEEKSRFELPLQQDTKVVLTHCNRLIRCMIDLQLSLRDSTSTKNALEMARSIAAKVWDNTPMQLKQIEGIGDITARRLAAHGLTTMEALSGAEGHQIELIMGRNPPFGSNLLSKVAQFPSLRVSVKESSRKRKDNGGVEIKLHCEIGFLNDKLPTYFNRKFLYVCFLCETIHGQLIDFRRIGANRVPNCQDISLTADIDRPTSKIVCHVMCDEVAGTHRYAELKMNIPSTWFHKQASLGSREHNNSQRKSNKSNAESEEFGDRNVLDEDFLMAETETNIPSALVEDVEAILGQKSAANASNEHLKRKLVMSEDAGEVVSGWHEPHQLPNGNWTCQHTCKEMNKDCKHVCCKDGVAKPKKRPRLDAGRTNLNKGKDSENHPSVYHEKQIDLPAETEMNYSVGIEVNTNIKQHIGRHNEGGQPDISSDSLPDAKDIVQSNLGKEHQKADWFLDPDGQTANDLDGDFEYFDLADDDIDLDFDNLEQRKTTLHVFPKGKEIETGSRRAAASNSPTESRTEEMQINKRQNDVANTIENSFPPAKNQLEMPLKPPNCQDNLVDDNYDDFDFDVDFADLNEQVSKPGPMPPEDSTSHPSTIKSDTDTVVDTTQGKLPEPSGNQSIPLLPGNVQTRRFSLISPAQEALKEQKKKDHEADQKKKWAKLEPWMYEQFGRFVDII